MIHEKDKVVYYVFEFLETKDINYSNIAKEWLTKLAKRYNLKLKPSKKRIKPQLKESYRDFLKNDKGYMVTIQQLYNSL